MILIVDSGSTRSTWCGVVGNEVLFRFEMEGMNPLLTTEEIMEDEISRNLTPFLGVNKIDRIYFYGAGCADSSSQMKVQNVLSLFFPDAIISIGSDIEGAAWGSLGANSGIACILGTGSSSCYWNGHQISKMVPSLGYLLGDEGSGSWFGKHLLRDYLRGVLPDALSDAIQKRFPYELPSFYKKIYQEPYPNRFIAGFFEVLKAQESIDYSTQLINEGLQQFIDRHVKMYAGYRDLPIAFSGSVAFELQPQLQQLAKAEGFNIVSISRNPIDGLHHAILKDLHLLT